MRILAALAAVLAAAGSVAGAAPLFVESGATVLGGLNVSARSGSWGDYDGDGDPDLLIQVTGSSPSNVLLRNETIGLETAAFTNVTDLLDSADGNSNDSWSAAWGDYDGDGDVDLFMGMTNGSSFEGDLLRNMTVETGTPEFVDVTAVTIPNDEWPQNLAWNDIDLDGDLDLLMGMELTPYELWLQGPGGAFTAAGAATGFGLSTSHAYGMAVGDSDGDGDTDVYISTCRGGGNIPNAFLVNQLMETGSLSFIDIANTNGTQYLANSYNAEFHDFDDDGDLDLFMVGTSGNPSKIFRNDGGNQFTDVDTVTGHSLLSTNGSSYNGGRCIDYDNDGDLDLFFHDNGFGRARKLFRNDGGWEFTDVTVAVGLDAPAESAFDSAWADYDLDGDLDLYAANTLSAGPERLFVSGASESGNGWFHVGASEERTLRRDANDNAGTFHQSDLPVHFGLGDATQIDALRVVWPNGSEQMVGAATVSQEIAVIYDAPSTPAGVLLN
jgi:hypothetical protein